MQEKRPSRPESREARKERRGGSKKPTRTAETGEPESVEARSAEQAPLSEPEQQEPALPAEETVLDLQAEEQAEISESEVQITPPAIVHKRRRRSGNALRASLAVVGGRTAGALSRRLHLGGGTSIAGVVAQRLYPDIVEHLSTQLQQGSVLVTGTNGKTTTSGFIAAILSDAGLRVWRNREGSNLMRGIAGALVIRTQPNGRLRRGGQAISIFEVDEAVMPHAAQTLPTRVAVFTNLFRDQLDRYGEVDTVLEHWKSTIRTLSPETILVLNADDPTVAALGELFSGRVIYFGIEDSNLALENQEGASERHQVIDTHTCPRCGEEYTYTLRFYSHIGHYRCTQCGYSRPQTTVRATRVTNESFDRLRISVETAGATGEIVVPLPGLYNVYNALAAIATAQALNIAWAPVVTGIEQFKPAFGRGERVQIAGRMVRMLLAKNPTGFNEVLRTLGSNGNKRHVLFVLNDNIADGKDISWIWDIDFEQAMDHFATLTIAGTRARDLALRLKYAGLYPDEMVIAPTAPLRAERKDGRPLALNKRRRSGKRGSQEGVDEEPVAAAQDATRTQTISAQSRGADRVYGIAQALDRAVERTPEGETLFIVPTYTGLLELHRELERRGLTPHYWEETGP